LIKEEIAEDEKLKEINQDQDIRAKQTAFNVEVFFDRWRAMFINMYSSKI